MVEKVETGGIMSFNYDGEGSKLSKERKEGIHEGYSISDERKRIKKRNTIILVIALILIALVVGILFVII